MKKINKAILLSALTLNIIVQSYSICDTVHAEDYIIELEMESYEIPINWIGNNRELYVPVKIKSNPGINSLFFTVEKDSRITGMVGAVREYCYPFGPYLQTVSTGGSNYVEVDCGYGYGADYYYDGTGPFCSLLIVLPENYSVGDVYNFSFYTEGQTKYKIGFEKDGEFYGPECVRYSGNGDIKIVPEVDNRIPINPDAGESSQNQNEENKTNSSQPENNSNNDNSNNDDSNNNNSNNINESVHENSNNNTEANNNSGNEGSVITSRPVDNSGAEVSQIRSTSITGYTESETKAESTVSESEKLTETTVVSEQQTEVISESTVFTESEHSEPVVTETEKSAENRVAFWIAGCAVLAAAVIAAVVFRKKKK